jgi:catechol 2,3-dioxygenase-like lactoylglutathione lyase family enzyme
VTDVQRSRQFYTSLLGCQVAVDSRRPATRPMPRRSASCSAAWS